MNSMVVIIITVDLIVILLKNSIKQLAKEIKAGSTERQKEKAISHISGLYVCKYTGMRISIQN